MMNPTELTNGSKERDLFLRALEKSDARERAAFLEGACGQDQALRQHVERLLAGFEGLGTFLEKPVVSAEAHASTAQTASRAITRQPVSEEKDERIGRYKLLQRVGEGGCGVVYVAEQEEPVRRRVALKVIKLGIDTKSVIARFEAERQALALMEHPNIARVLDAGATESGRPYFVMELVRGIRITGFCDSNQLPTTERLNLFIQVCHAVQHAHQKGIIHRDLKPSNILVTLHDGVPVPKVIDFGIAKATQQPLTNKTVFTQLQQFLGTPAYMSPEQMELSGLDIDTRSDIYALGVLLYELLTGGTPFDARTLLKAGFEEMRRIIQEKEPPRPSTRLSTLNCRAVAFSPDSRRLAVGGTGRMFVWDIAARREVFSFTNRFTNRFPNLGDPKSLTNAPTWGLAYSPDGQRIAIGLFVTPAIVIADADTGQVLMELSDGETNNVPSLAFSSDGSKLAAATAGGTNGAARVWDLASGRLLHRLGVGQGSIWQIGFDPTGRRLITAHWESNPPGAARIWNLETGALEHTLEGIARPLQCALFSPQGDRIYTAGWDEQVRIWDCASFREIGRLPKGHGRGIISMALSRDGRHLLTGSWDGEAKLWDAERLDEPPTFRTAFWPEERGGLVRFFGGLRGPYATLSPTATAGLILTLAPSNEVVVADFVTQREVFRIPTGHRTDVSALAVAHDLRRLVTAADDGSVFVWDARQGARLFAFEGHTNRVNGITFSPDSRRTVTVSADGTARLWDDSGRLLKTLAVGTNVFLGVMSPDSRWLALSRSDGQNAIWNLESGQPVRTLPHQAGSAFGFAWTADSRRVVSAGRDMVARVWEVSSGKLLAQCQGHTFPIWSIALSPDGRRLVTGSMDRTARVWDVATGRELLTLTGHTSDVHSVAWSADGRQIVTGSADQTMKTWEAATPEDIAAWQAEEAEAARQLSRPRETAGR